MSDSDQSRIDELLERYLGLLDEYTRLRDDLSRLQRGMFQDIARANFSAERGVRYGQDQYDERMQASRKLAIENEADDGVPRFTVVAVPDEKDGPAPFNVKDAEAAENKAAEPRKATEASKKKSKANKDPARWYGLFVPPALRSAQTNAIQSVEDIIPRLVSVNAEMLGVEIQVRRARKKRAKAEAADKKQQSDSEKVASVEVEAS